MHAAGYGLTARLGRAVDWMSSLRHPSRRMSTGLLSRGLSPTRMLGLSTQVLPVATAFVACSLARSNLRRLLPDPIGARRATSLPSGIGAPSALESLGTFVPRAATPRSGLATSRGASDTRFARCAAR